MSNDLQDLNLEQTKAELVKARAALRTQNTVWHCLRVQLGMDIRVGCDLRQQGYREFVAFTFERRQIGITAVVWPTLRFSGYVFVQRQSGQEFRPIVETLGVEDVLSIGNCNLLDGLPNPSVVPDHVIEVFRWDMIEDYDEASRRIRRKDCMYRKGDRILAHRGPWEGREFVVMEARAGRVTVELPNGWPMPLFETDIMPVHKAGAFARAGVAA